MYSFILKKHTNTRFMVQSDIFSLDIFIETITLWMTKDDCNVYIPDFA